MVNEISQNVLSGVAAQPKGTSENPGRVRERSHVDTVKEATKPSSTKQDETIRQAPGQVDGKAIDEAVEQLNEFTQSVQRKLEFSVDEESGKTIVKVIDKESGEMVRSIPSEEILDMQKRLRETSEAIFNSNDQGISLLFQGKA